MNRPLTRVKAMACVLAAAAALLATSVVRAQRYVSTANPALPRLKYADSLRSVNDRCVVTHNKLNPQIVPQYVNGKPVGFC
jgi:hypothetical protein